VVSGMGLELDSWGKTLKLRDLDFALKRKAVDLDLNFWPDGRR
jgi:hypothetical protein